MSLLDVLHDVYLDTNNASLTENNLKALSKMIPKDIMMIGATWGWNDTEFGDMVFRWIRDSSIVIEKEDE